MRLKILSVKWRPYCPGGDEITVSGGVPDIWLSRDTHVWLRAIMMPVLWLLSALEVVIITSDDKLSSWKLPSSLHWRHNDHNDVSYHQSHVCLPNRLFRRRSKKTSKLRVTGLCVGNSPGPVNSPHKGPVTQKMSPFDGVIMIARLMGPTRCPSGADRTPVGPCWPHELCYLGISIVKVSRMKQSKIKSWAYCASYSLLWTWVSLWVHLFITLRLRQNGRQFPDDIFKRIFLNENILILIKKFGS